MSLTHVEFEHFFRPFVRVLFDWDRMISEHWPIRSFVTERLTDLNDWRLPWNFDPSGSQVPYDDPAAMPMTLGELPSLFPKLDTPRRAFITAMAEGFVAGGVPVQLVVPAYAIDSHCCLLMDGNHRLCALQTSGVEFRLLAFILNGPVDSSIIPELRHFGREAAS